MEENAAENVTELKEQIDQFYRDHNFKGLDDFLVMKCAQYQLDADVDPAAFVYIYNEAGAYFRESGQFDQSVKAFEELIKYMDEHNMAMSPGYATVVNNLAGTNRMMGNYSRATELFFRCLDLYKASGSDDSFEYASALNNIALLYLVEKEYDKAEEYQLKALDHPATGSGLTRAVSISNLANIYAAKGDIDKAVETIQTTHQFLDKVPQKSGTTRYVSVLNTEACLYLRKGEYDKACDLFDHILEVLEEASPMSQDYAAVCRTAANAHLSKGNKERAISLQETALKINTRIFGENSNIAVQDAKLLENYKNA